MNRRSWIRTAHRWLSIAFTVAVIANIAVMDRDEPVVWIGILALIPLSLLLLSGLYLFVLPYVSPSPGRRYPRSNLR